MLCENIQVIIKFHDLIEVQSAAEIQDYPTLIFLSNVFTFTICANVIVVC